MPNGFGPKERSRRLLRQAAGLMPPSDVQPPSARPPAIQAQLNLQLGAGLIGQERFKEAMYGNQVGAGTAGRRPSRASTQAQGLNIFGQPLSPFSAALQRRPRQFRERALAGRRRTRASMTRLGFF